MSQSKGEKLFSALVHLAKMTHCSNVILQINLDISVNVSRPTEKTIFLIFMFCVGVFCIFLNFLELNHLGWKMIKKSMLIKDSSWRGYGAINQDSQSIASLTFRDVTSTTSLPTLDLVVDHQPDWTCVGNCSTKKDKDTYRGTQSLKGKSQPNKERKLKQRSTEVWI